MPNTSPIKRSTGMNMFSVPNYGCYYEEDARHGAGAGAKLGFFGVRGPFLARDELREVDVIM